MNDFALFYRLTLTEERDGVFTDNPNDPGGATKSGVIQTTYDDWRRRQHLVPQSVRLMDQAEQRAIYLEFWEACYGHVLPAPLNGVTFDFAVNASPRRALKRLQYVVGVVQDGIIGPKTLAAIQARPLPQVVNDYLWVRVAYYEALARANHKLASFWGWIPRVRRLREHIGYAQYGGDPSRLKG